MGFQGCIWVKKKIRGFFCRWHWKHLNSDEVKDDHIFYFMDLFAWSTQVGYFTKYSTWILSSWVFGKILNLSGPGGYVLWKALHVCALLISEGMGILSPKFGLTQLNWNFCPPRLFDSTRFTTKKLNRLVTWTFSWSWSIPKVPVLQLV